MPDPTDKTEKEKIKKCQTQPFHESIVKALESIEGPDHDSLFALESLLRITTITENHHEILSAYNAATNRVVAHGPVANIHLKIGDTVNKLTEEWTESITAEKTDDTDKKRTSEEITFRDYLDR